nr:ribonuclease H-like domain, reverse transcriptase, RNA-dependent DNA polymerase [Tanacetum cinerariifolium]
MPQEGSDHPQLSHPLFFLKTGEIASLALKEIVGVGVDNGRLQEEPHNLYNEDIVVENLAEFEKKELVLGNCNQHEHRGQGEGFGIFTLLVPVVKKDFHYTCQLPLWTQDPSFSSSSKDSPGAGYKLLGEEEKKDTEDPKNEDSEAPITEELRVNQEKDNVNNTNRVNAVSSTVNAASNEVNDVGRKSSIELLDDPNMPELEDISIFKDSNEDVFGAEADLNNLESTFQEMCTEFEKMMHKKFQMSSIGELTFFLGLDYAGASLDRKSTTGGCQFLGCGLISWQYKKQIVVANSTTEAEEGCLEWNAKAAQDEIDTNAHNLNVSAVKEAQIHANVDGKKVIISEATIRRDLKFEDEGRVNCLSNEVIFEQITLMGTMASAIIFLASTQKFNFSKYIFESMVKHLDNGNKFLMYPRFLQVFLDTQVDGMSKHNAIYVIPYHIKKKKQKSRKSKNKDTQETQPNDPTYKALNEENVPTQSNDPSLSRVNSLGSREDNLKLKELMELCTKLFNRVLNLETTKTAQVKEISSLKKRVKRLEKKKRLGTHGLKRLYKVGLSARVESSAKEQSLGEENASRQGRNITEINADAKITLAGETAEDQGRFDDQEMFDTRVLDDEEVVVKKEAVVKEVDTAQDQVSAATTTTAKDLTIDDVTLAKALKALKTSKPKIKGIVVRDHKEPSESTIIPTSIADSTRPKAKGIVMEEPSEITTTTIPIPLKFKTKAKIKVDFELAQRLQAEEQEKLTNDEKAKLLMEFLEKRRKSELKESSSKRARDELEQESAKKQKVDDVQKAAKLKRCLEIVPDDKDDVTIDATPLSSKSPTIIDYKIHKERRKSYFQIIRADGSSQMYYTFSKMLKNFNKEDLEVLWSIVKARFEKVQPVDDMDCYLLHTLKTMFKHRVKDSVWKNQQGLAKVKNWKLFDSCGVHCVSMQNTAYFLLVEKIYPLSNYTLTQMWNDVKL